MRPLACAVQDGQHLRGEAAVLREDASRTAQLLRRRRHARPHEEAEALRGAQHQQRHPVLELRHRLGEARQQVVAQAQGPARGMVKVLPCAPDDLSPARSRQARSLSLPGYHDILRHLGHARTNTCPIISGMWQSRRRRHLNCSTDEGGRGGIISCRRAIWCRCVWGAMTPSETPSTTDCRDSRRACAAASPATATSVKPRSPSSARQPSLTAHQRAQLTHVAITRRQLCASITSSHQTSLQ